ncbi:hypothetical protein, partial [Pantoea anthophila]|uniref:hypothetical protein n=1 Tax=Pantoea anthophila TaxID=470931 RepID=UPI00142D7EEB
HIHAPAVKAGADFHIPSQIFGKAAAKCTILSRNERFLFRTHRFIRLIFFTDNIQSGLNKLVKHPRKRNQPLTLVRFYNVPAWREVHRRNKPADNFIVGGI